MNNMKPNYAYAKWHFFETRSRHFVAFRQSLVIKYRRWINIVRYTRRYRCKEACYTVYPLALIWELKIRCELRTWCLHSPWDCRLFVQRCPLALLKDAKQKKIITRVCNSNSILPLLILCTVFLSQIVGIVTTFTACNVKIVTVKPNANTRL